MLDGGALDGGAGTVGAYGANGSCHCDIKIYSLRFLSERRGAVCCEVHVLHEEVVHIFRRPS